MSNYTIVAELKNGAKVQVKTAAKTKEEAEVIGNRVILDRGFRAEDVESVTIE